MEQAPKTYGKLCSLFYDATKNYAPAREVDFYASFMDKNSRTLEAMAGSGRLLIPLMQRGFIVDGVDNSTIMLDRCRERCKAFNVSPDLYTQDITQLALPHMYATVTIAVGSFQLITDKNHAQQALIALGKHVCKNGSILIDIFTPDTHGPTRTIRTATINNHTTIRLTTHHVYHEQEKLAEGFCTYELIEYGVIQQKEQEIITVTWYTDAEFEELLNTAGFKLIKIYEESLRPTGPSRIVHARKI